MANFELRIYEIPVDDEIYDKVIEEYKNNLLRYAEKYNT